MSVFARLFGKIADTAAPDEASAQQAYEQMRAAMAQETPEQKKRFYLEVAALLGNKSAAERLKDLPKETPH